MSSILNKKAVKELASGEDGFKVSKDFYEALEVEVNNSIDSAVSRMKSNNRRTVYNYDL